MAQGAGKLLAIAKGARKGGSRLAGISEPLTFSRLTLAQGRVRSFVTQAQPKTSFPGIRADYDRLVAGMAICEVLDALLPYESPADEELHLGLTALECLAADQSWKAVSAWFLSRLLDAEGRQPDWTKCARGGDEISAEAWMCPEAGGLVSRAEHGSVCLTPVALEALRRLPALDAPPSNLRDAEVVLEAQHALWREILERPLRTLGQAVGQAKLEAVK